MTINETHDDLDARWARLGVLLNCAPAATAPDVERAVIDAARAVSERPHLIPLVVTWLAVHGLGVARHRLRAFAVAGLDARSSPVLGLLLDEAIGLGAPAELRIVRDVCRPAARPGPLVAAFQTHPGLRGVA